jgi:ATP-dependent DNA ligase
MTGLKTSIKRRGKMKATRREGIMLCYPYEEKRLLKWSTPWIIQPKLDGVRCRAIFDEAGEVQLLSSEQNEIVSVPHINRHLQEMNLPSGTELDGELYTHGLSFEEIVSRTSRSTNLHKQYQDIEYHIFDIVSDDPQYKRLSLLSELAYQHFHNPFIKFVHCAKLHTKDDVMEWFDKYIKEGYEGFVMRNNWSPYLRKRSVWLMKFKPKKSDYYVIAGSVEEVSIQGQPKNRLGALVLHSPDQWKPGLFNVGTGFTDEQREQLWKHREELVGEICEVKYQHLTDKQVPRFPVFVMIHRSAELLGKIRGRL